MAKNNSIFETTVSDKQKAAFATMAKNNSIFALILRSEQIIPFAVFDNDSDNVHKMMYKSVMFSQFRFHQPIH